MYNIFAVLYLRIRLFALLTAGKGNGTGVYAEISFHEFYHFSFYLFVYLFVCFIFILFFLYFFFTHDIYPHPHPRPTTHDPPHLATLCIRPSVGLLLYVVAVHRPSQVLRKMDAEELKYRDLINIGPTNRDWAKDATIVVKKVNSHGLAFTGV